jgi:RNA polymerase sigma-70 factor, ECF subfamily
VGTAGIERRIGAGARRPEAESVLAERAFAGDARAFEAIVVRYQGPVLGLAGRYLKSTADAEDAAQEAFVRAFVHREKFDRARPILPWLLTVTRYVCVDRLRRVRREEPLEREAEAVAASARTAEDEAGDRELAARLAEALEALPEAQREVVAMFHLDGMSYREIADAADVPIGTVMTWLHRGRARLKELVFGGIADGDA